MLRSVFHDLRVAFRAARGAPWLSSVAVLTFALGIGASVATFGVLDQVFLRPLPFPDADRLVVGRATIKEALNPWVAGADYYDYREQSDAFEELAAVLPFAQDVTLSGRGDAERVSATVGSDNLFATLRVTAAVGRVFRPEDGTEGAENVVLLTHGFWQRRLGGNPGVVGTALTLDGVPHTVVGILPSPFFFMTPADVWLPMRPDRDAASRRDMHNWFLVGRLKAGVTREQAQAGLDVISARLQEAYPESNRDKALRLGGLRPMLREDYQQRLWVVSGAAVLLLLLACGNGAGILLARAPARRFEMSVRAALGATWDRLVRQLLAESLGLALAGGLLGALLAIWLQRAVVDYLGVGRLGLAAEAPALATVAAALTVSLLAGLLAGLYPALRGARDAPAQGLTAGGRGAGDGGSGFRTGLVVAQVALSVVLLSGSGLLVRSFLNLKELDPGFRSEGLLTAEVQLPLARYPGAAERARFFSTFLDEVRSVPGVQTAALTSHLPIGDFGNTYRAATPGDAREPQRIFLRAAFPGALETLGIPLLSGREVEEGGDGDGPWVVILSRTAAERFFPGADPLGKVVDLQLVGGPRPMEVIGVAGDVRLSRLEDEPEAALWVPYAQHPRNVMRLVVAGRLPVASVAASLRGILRRMDPEVPLARVATLERLVDASLADRKTLTLSLVLLALLPLLLASAGLFALLAYYVSRRRREMGVRMALGATASRLGAMVLRQALGRVAVGVLVGLGGALAGARVLRGMLFGVASTDPWTLLAVSGAVLGVAVLASAVPVWRAARSDPRVAMQGE